MDEVRLGIMPEPVVDVEGVRRVVFVVFVVLVKYDCDAAWF